MAVRVVGQNRRHLHKYEINRVMFRTNLYEAREIESSHLEQNKVDQIGIRARGMESGERKPADQESILTWGNGGKRLN